MSRELLHEAACALQNFLNSAFPYEWDDAVRQFIQDLIERLDAESEKPEPVECGELEVLHGYPFGLLDAGKKLPPGKYLLLAVRIDNE